MKFWPAMVLCLIVTGCAAPNMTDTRVSYDNSARLVQTEDAEKGNPEAQFALGNSYCCGDGGFWDTKLAIEWWCRAAAQGHASAKARLAELDASCPIQP